MTRIQSLKVGFSLASCLLATASLLTLFPAYCLAQPAGVIAHWRFDEDMGVLVLDSSPNGNDGSISGAIRVPGLLGNALLFDDRGDRVIVPHQNQQNVTTNRLTMEAIIRPASTQASGLFIPILAKNVPAQRDGYSMFIGSSNHIFAFFGDGSARSIVANTPLPIDEWTHVAAWFDGSESRIYINCKLDATRPNVDTILPSFRFIELGGSSHPLRGSINGSIDEIRITEDALEPGNFLSGGCNERPVAKCQNIVVQTSQSDCVAAASIDNGSFDPDGDPIALTQSPPGPYALGETPVTLTVADDSGLQDSCRSTVTFTDVAAPEIECATPPAITPPDAPISFTALGFDNCGVSTVSITEFDCFKFTRNGKRIDKTESCAVVFDSDTLWIEDSGGVGTNITWEVTAVDTSGNDIRMGCGVEVVNPGQRP